MRTGADVESNTPLTPGDADHRERLRRALGADYMLGELLAQGGMGAVYVAHDRKLERDVAVKALRHDVFPTPMVLERFSREAKALAKLRHPNILPVYAVGQGDGLAFMIMPRIQGESLRVRLARDGPLSVSVALRIASEVARALDAAHQVGIVHRDVKPENILLEGNNAHALLADFGIAKSRGDDAALTASGMLIGSPRYMSPEQMGDESVDARSDIYSLGAVLYEMLAGKPPFEADSLQRLMVLQLTTDPPALSSVAPGVDARLSGIVMRCLARGASERWESASALLEAIGAVSASSAAPASEPRSVLDRRGLLAVSVQLAFFYLLVTWDLLAASSARGTSFVLTGLVEPLIKICLLILAAIGVEAVVVFVRTRRRSGTRAAVRAVVGQPRWWLTWYPRSLRATSDAWSRMSWELKILRSFVFFGVVGIPIAFPLIFVAPSLQRAASGIPLALPVRNMITVSVFMQRPVFGIGLSPANILALWFVLALLAYAARRRISLAATVRAIFSGREPS